MLMRFADDIKLTDEQISKLEAMTTEFQKQMVDRRAGLKKAQIDLRSLMREDEPNENQVLAAIDEVNSLKAEIQKQQFRHRQQVHGLLTDEQIETLKQKQKERFNDRPGRGVGRNRGAPDNDMGWFDDED
jgi:Spy/CpxP family protein refolding chaperone